MSSIMSWGEFEKKMVETFGRSFRLVDQLYFNVEKEIRIGERVSFGDLEVLGYLQSLHHMKGELCVITDHCYERDHGPFVVGAEEITGFVDTYPEVFHDAFYSTDIIIVNFEEKLLWVFFHEGMCWLSRGLVTL